MECWQHSRPQLHKNKWYFRWDKLHTKSSLNKLSAELISAAHNYMLNNPGIGSRMLCTQREIRCYSISICCGVSSSGFNPSASTSSSVIPEASTVLETHSLSGSSFKSSRRRPANIPPMKATGSYRTIHRGNVGNDSASFTYNNTHSHGFHFHFKSHMLLSKWSRARVTFRWKLLIQRI